MRTVTGDCGRTGQSREGLIGGREELLDRFLLIGGKALEASATTTRTGSSHRSRVASPCPRSNCLSAASKICAHSPGVG